MSEQDPRIEMEVTIKFKYLADPNNYGVGNPTPAKMAKIDKESFEDDHDLLLEIVESENYTVTVKPVTN